LYLFGLIDLCANYFKAFAVKQNLLFRHAAQSGDELTSAALILVP